MVNVSMKGKDTIIDIQDNIEEITLNSDDYSIELKRADSEKQIILRFTEAVYFTLIESFKNQ